MARYVVDCETLLGIAAGDVRVAPAHTLVAPTLVRSQALSTLYRAVGRGELDAAEARAQLLRINSLKVRFLGDKVLQQAAWSVADELGWDDTFDAEYVALTRLQADAFVTSDRQLARRLKGVVEVLAPSALSRGALSRGALSRGAAA